MSNSIWARVKAAVIRATPAPADPPHDRHVTAWLQQQARRNDVDSLPRVGMHISTKALETLCAPTPAERHDITAQLTAASPPTPTTAADLLPHSPPGPWA